MILMLRRYARGELSHIVCYMESQVGCIVRGSSL